MYLEYCSHFHAVCCDVSLKLIELSITYEYSSSRQSVWCTKSFHAMVYRNNRTVPNSHAHLGNENVTIMYLWAVWHQEHEISQDHEDTRQYQLTPALLHQPAYSHTGAPRSVISVLSTQIKYLNVARLSICVKSSMTIFTFDGVKRENF